MTVHYVGQDVDRTFVACCCIGKIHIVFPLLTRAFSTRPGRLADVLDRVGGRPDTALPRHVVSPREGHWKAWVSQLIAQSLMLEARKDLLRLTQAGRD